MFKKIIAGVASVALALGMVALTAGPASAHTPNVTASCTAVNVNFTNYSNSDTNHLEVWLDGTKVADVADFNSPYSATYNFTQVLATHTYEVKVDVSGGTQYDYNVGQKTVGNCLPDDTDKKVEICHWDSAGNYTYNNISVSAVINVPNGHAYHPEDIIPPFSYVKQGVSGSFAGLNWPAGQARLNNHCDDPEVTPATPTHTDAVCTGPGQVGQGSYTIPATEGVRYLQKFTNNSSYQVVSAGTYSLNAGEDVYIKAEELDGYELTGNDNQYSWHFDIGGPSASKCVVPAAPTFNAQVCLAPGVQSQASYTIPVTAGVKYQRSINDGAWSDVSAATVNVNSFTTKIGIRAVATGSSVIVPGSVVEWTFTFNSAGDCITLVTATAPSFADGLCYAVGQNSAGSYTIPAAVAGTKYQVKFTPGGAWADKAAGTYALAAGEDVYIQAVALNGYSLTGTTSWYFVIGGPDSDECVAPAAPSVTQAVCEGPGEWSQASYTVPYTEGIQYQQWDGSSWVNIGSGTVDVNAFPTTIQWQAVAIAPFVIAPGSVTSWTLELVSPGDCLEQVTAIADIDQAVCSGNGVIQDANYIISTTVGVYYQVSIDGGPAETKAAGTYPVPTGTEVTITAFALTGYQLVGTTTWTDTIDVPEECFKVEGDPTFHEGCDVQTNTWSSPNFKVFAAEHVTYTWKLNGVDQGAIVAGTYAANAGDTVEITAHADPGFELNENPWLWTHTFADPTGTCQLEPPVLSCLLADEEGILPLGALEHADWVVNGVNKGSGAQNVQLSTSNTTISVVAHEGYEFGGEATTSWTFDLDENGLCDLPTEATWPTSVTHTDEVCTSARAAKGTITVDTVEGEVQYFLNGVPFASSTVTVEPGTYTVTAEAVDPDDGLTGVPEAGFWTVVVKAAASSTCDLTTLALTGVGSNPIGWAGIGYYLLVTGLALIAVRTLRRRNEVKQ